MIPPITKRIENLVGTASDVIVNTVKGQPVFADDSKINERLQICENCEFLVKERNICGKCGCFVQMKTKLKASQCPKNKW